MDKSKKIQYCFYAFLIPFLILLLTFFNKTDSIFDFFISDSREQYLYIFQYLKGVLEGENSIFYFFGRGIGGAMFTTFSYYLSSPLNLLFLCVDKAHVPHMMVLVTWIKISLCGLTMFWYLDHTNQNHPTRNLLFAISYALMDYNLVYFINIMWLDVVVLAPLVIYGLEKIARGEKSKMYVICLFLAMVSNFYISYMLCLFCVLYFLYLILKEQKWKKKKECMRMIKNFLISSILAAGLASFILLPVIQELRNVYRDGTFSSEIQKQTLFDVLLQFASVKPDFGGIYVVPHYSCGSFVLYQLLYYLFFQKKKKKKIEIIYLMFFMCSFFFIQLIKIWHGMDIPALFFHRWSFLFTFFLIAITSKNYEENQKLEWKKMIFILVVYICGIVLCSHLGENDGFNLLFLFINGFFLIAIAMIYHVPITKQTKSLILITLTIIELYVSANTVIVFNSQYKEPQKNCLLENYMSFENNLEILEENSYTRVGGENIFAADELFSMNVGKIQFFLSSNNQKILNFFKNSGYQVNQNQIYDDLYNEVLNDLLGVQYWYSLKERKGEVTQTFAFCDNLVKVYKRNSLSIGYVIENNDIQIDNSNPFEYQNSLFEKIYGEKLFHSLNYSISEDGILVNNKGESFYLKEEKEELNDISDEEYGYISRITKIDSDKEYTDIKISNMKNATFYVYELDEDKKDQMLNELSKQQIENINVKKNRMNFKINSKKEQSLLLTVPYDENFIVLVNNKKIEPEKIFDTFIGIPLVEGENRVELIYKNSNFYKSVLISLSFLGINFFFFKKNKNKV